MEFTLDDIWNEHDRQKSHEISDKIERVCVNCNNSDNINEIDNEIICTYCGIIIDNDVYEIEPVFEESIPIKKYNNNNKINKLIQWYMWSNEEKTIYKLKEYTTNLCNKLEIPEYLISQIINTVIEVMDVIKKNDGSKRSRVKDGIIINCIHYTTTNEFNILAFNCFDMAKKLSLDIKYITKADKLITELLNSGKVKLYKIVNKSPYDYINQVIIKYQLNISINIKTKMQRLISICENNDMLLNNTPLSIGACCFFYILILFKNDINAKDIAQMFNISHVTVIKTLSKLNTKSDFIDNQLIKI